MAPRRQMIGQKFGRLTVIELAGRRERRLLYRCVCDCGTETVKLAGSLQNGETRSCGCLSSETQIATKTTHGHSKTATYRSWSHMKTRCLNPNFPAFAEWGGRGITICERWMVFENFLADMGEHPGPGYSIDRIDNDGNYEPGNCRWATWAEQASNKRRSRSAARYTVRGITGTLSEVAAAFGIKPNAVYMRLQKGIPADEAFTAPLQRIHSKR